MQMDGREKEQILLTVNVYQSPLTSSPNAKSNDDHAQHSQQDTYRRTDCRQRKMMPRVQGKCH